MRSMIALVLSRHAVVDWADGQSVAARGKVAFQRKPGANEGIQCFPARCNGQNGKEDVADGELFHGVLHPKLIFVPPV